MERPKWVAIATGILAIALGVGYLLLVQLLDYRGGEFLPAPLDPLAVMGGGLELLRISGIPGLVSFLS